MPTISATPSRALWFKSYWGYLALLGLAIWCWFTVSHVELHRVFRDADGIYKIGLEYEPGWTSFAFEPFSGHHIQLAYVMIHLLYSASVFVLGLAILSPFLKHEKIPLWATLGSSYAIAYFWMVVQNRLLTFLFPHAQAPAIIFAATFLAAMILFFLRKVPQQITEKVAASKTPFYQTLGLLFLLFAFFLLEQIQFGRNYMVSDSTMFYLQYFNDALKNVDPLAHFPLTDQQYDEVIFNYPLLFLESGRKFFLLPFWSNDALGKASVFCLLFSLLKARLPNDKWQYAMAPVTFAYFGTFALIPWYYISLVGGQNPLIYNGHIGRMLGVALPILVFDGLEWLFRQPNQKIKPFSLFFLIILSLGLAGTSINNVMNVSVMSAVFFAFKVFRIETNGLRKKLTSTGLFLGIAAPILTYVVFFSYIQKWGGEILVGTALVGMGFVVASLPFGAVTLNKIVLKKSLLWLTLLLAPAVLASLLFGNLATWVFLPKLFAFFPAIKTLFPAVYDFPILSRGYGVLDQSGFFIWQGCSTPSHHCYDGNFYLSHYALITGCALWLTFQLFRTSNVTERRAGLNAAIFDEPENADFILIMLSYSVFSLCFGHFLVDFVSSSTSTWIRTRFLENAIYTVFFVFGLVLSRNRQRANQRILLIICWIWALLPFFVNLGIAQPFKNLYYLWTGHQ